MFVIRVKEYAELHQFALSDLTRKFYCILAKKLFTCIYTFYFYNE
jgi:hypothetical protein